MKETIKRTLEKNQTSSGANNVVACVASVFVRFRSKSEERELNTARKMGRVKEMGRGARKKGGNFLPLPLFHFLALVPFFAWPKPKIPFVVVPRNFFAPKLQETFATQANNVAFQSNKKFQLPPQLHVLFMSILKSHIWRFTATPCVIQISACYFSPKWFESMFQSPNLVEGVMRTS